MRIDISDIKTIPGAKLMIDESGVIPDLKNTSGAISITGPVAFKGVLTNINGMLSLKGEATCIYETQCDYCTKPITRELRVTIDEVLVETDGSGGDMIESDEYTYQGNLVVLDKILSDNAVLSMPMRHRCKKDCRIICPECGEPATGMGCGCNEEQSVDPRRAPLKKLIENKNTEDAD